MRPTPRIDRLAAGRAALDAGAWERARDELTAAPPTGEALEALGWALWWLGDGQPAIDVRQRAYRAFRAAGDPVGAARVATWMAADFREVRGEDAVGRGWLVRAHRLLAGRPTTVEHGWLTLIDGDFALNVDADAIETERLSALGARIGRELGSPDLEAVGLGQGGIALVLLGRVEEGMARLDEASAIAAGEDLALPVSAAWSLCCVVSACNGVGDVPRATQWCAVMRSFAERWGGRQVTGICRSAYGRVLATGGDWRAAETEMTAAVDELQACRPYMAGGSIARLGELRARQGRREEARALFEQAGGSGVLGLGGLALEAGDATAAADAAERVLRALPQETLLERLPALELAVRAHAALGRLDAARAAHVALHDIAQRVHTPYLRGRAHLAGAILAAAGGAHDDARRHAEDAVDCLTVGSAPYDAAQARVTLAAALDALGRHAAASAEREAARAVFAALGARADLEWLTDVRPAAASDLSAREVEVLRLVADGRSDAEIAARLVVSPHTVHRHVANIRTKLRAPSRSAAVAAAARAGLL